MTQDANRLGGPVQQLRIDASQEVPGGGSSRGRVSLGRHGT
jgi:hypothetical protein